MTSTLSTLVSYGGWLCQQYFGKNASSYSYINNCKTDDTCDGNNTDNDYANGLICGQYAYKVICNYCSSHGLITGGGIFGKYCGYCQANNCVSTGQIGGNNLNYGSGGIFGPFNSFTNQAINCYSTGSIEYNGNYGSGGICGQSNSVVVINCFSKGNIGFGTISDISYPCGGIYGNLSTGTASNCYSSGQLLNLYCLGIGGKLQISCYIANGSWSDSDANKYLIDTPSVGNQVGNIWYDSNITSLTTPYTLTSNLNNYYTNSPDNIYNILIEQETTIYINNQSSIFVGQTYTLDVAGETYISKAQSNGYVSFTFIPKKIGYLNMVLKNESTIISSNLIIRVLNNTINTSTTITNNDISNYYWPIIIKGGTESNPTIVTFGDNISLYFFNQYFIIGSDYVTVEGNYKNISINNVLFWLGLFQNGNYLNMGYSNIIINNITMNSISSELAYYDCGWLCQSFYAKGSLNCFLNNLSSNGKIGGSRSGGIVGSYCAASFGNLFITNCFSSGDIYYGGGGICGCGSGYDNGNVSIIKCRTKGNIVGNYAGGINGTNGGQLNGTILISECYTNGDIIGNYSGGLTADWFGLNSNNLNQIINSYSTGNIIGPNSGGICGAEVGFNYDSSLYVPNILISNCYVLGKNNSYSDSGAICGGSDNNIYSNNPVVNISNCYVLYGPIVSQKLQITPIQTLTYISPTNIWVDLSASTYLLETPKYNSSGSLVNPVGTVWTDIASDSNSVPWIFSTLGYSPYTTILVTTINQTIEQGGKSIEALDTSGPIYTLVAINDKLTTDFPKITMNNSTGQITIGDNTLPGIYLIKVLQEIYLTKGIKQLNLTGEFIDTIYTMTNFNLNVSDRCTKYYIKMKKNKELVIKLNKIFAGYYKNEKYHMITNPKHGCAKFKSNFKLIYEPNENYIGKDKFSFECKNINSKLNIQVTFKIKITK